MIIDQNPDNKAIVPILNPSDVVIYLTPPPLDQNPAGVYLAGLNTPKSRETMQQALDGIAQLLGAIDCFDVNWSSIRFQHVNAIKSQLGQMGKKPATVNKYLCAIRGVLLAAKQLGQIGLEDYDRAVSVKGVKYSTLPAGRDVDDKEIRRLFAVCEADNTPAGVRDAAILGVMRLGLRVSEIVGLTFEDFRQGESRLMVRGKGQKERLVPISGGSLRALMDWLAVRGSEAGPLFLPVLKNGRVQYKALSRQAVVGVCQKRATEAKIADFSPHDFRRTFVGDLLDAGADIVTVKDLAGHASIQTTARYDRRGAERLRNAIDLLNTPYTGRRQTVVEATS